MEKNILADFFNVIKSFASEALEKCETEEQEEIVASDDVQVKAEEIVNEDNTDSIATTKGNEEKNVVEDNPGEAPILEASEEDKTDETEGNPDTLKNVDVPEEKSDEERLFETAEQLCAIAEQIYKRSDSMTKKQANYVAKVLAKHSQKIAKYCVKKQK